jgi:NitT/TauT family transport system ATP-binding protein
MVQDVVVQLKNISMKYHSLEAEIEALNNINLDIHKGEFVSIVGPSGCGKSTLLSIMAGLLKQSSGTVLINKEEITEPSSNVGYMLQKDHLFEWRTILQNALLGLEIQNKITETNKNYVIELLNTYGLKDFKNHYPRQLSGGMRQRAALIRTLAIKPEILLLDEAFSALDYQTRLAVSDEIYTILKKENKTAVIVTHDISEAIAMADRVIVLSRRPAAVKSMHTINLTCDGCTPLRKREAPEFRHYFNTIWKELDIHV